MVDRPPRSSTGVAVRQIHSYEPKWKDNGFSPGPTQAIWHSKAPVPYGGGVYYSPVAAACRRVVAGVARVPPQPLQVRHSNFPGREYSDP